LTPWAKDVDPARVLPKYPRPQMVRSDGQNLNGLWQFQAAEAGDTVPVGQNLGGRILVPFPWESALSGVRKLLPSGRAWYRRTFAVPVSWEGRRVLLHFGAVGPSQLPRQGRRHDEYEKFIEQLRGFKNKGGLSGAVYTQWTDVENEMNGIYTYDRKVIKLHRDRVTKANESTWQNDLAP